jgi:hypothetical protein
MRVTVSDNEAFVSTELLKQVSWFCGTSPLLFAIISTKNVSGFSPLELLFGPSCRTHLTLLKEVVDQE